MKQVSGFILKEWVPLSLCVLLNLPLSFVAATAWFGLLNQFYSRRDLALAAFAIFILLIWVIWSVTKKFLNWLESKQFNASRRDYLLLIVALIPVIAAIYNGWNSYWNNEFPNTFISNYEVEITSSSNTVGNICILEIKDQNGKKIPPEDTGGPHFLLTGDWIRKRDGCQYFSQGDAQGSLKFFPIGTPAEFFQILFRENKNGGIALVRINGEQIANTDLHNEQEGNQLVSVQLQHNNMERLLWNILGTAGGSAVLVILLMLLTLLFNNIQVPSQVRQLFDTFSHVVEKHPWIRFAPIAIGIAIMFWPTGSYQSSDVAYYLSLAKNLFHGNGYVNPDLSPNTYRGPVLPLLISLSYMLFGETFRSAMIVERIFWALTILISYILGKELFNQRTGFLASLFILSVSVINITFNFVWTDGPVTFLTLVLQLMFWNIFKKQFSNKWYVLMGLLMGTAYLLKQTVIFILPLPIIMWGIFSEFRTGRIFKQLLITYSIFALIYFGWDGYVHLVGGSSAQATDTLTTIMTFLSYISRLVSFTNTGQTSSIQTEVAKHSSTSIIQILSLYYTKHIASFFKIAIIFPVALVFTLYQAVVRKIKADTFLLLGLILYFPLILLQVIVDFGFRQDLYFYCIVMILIAAMLDRIFRDVLSGKVSNILVVIVALCLVIIQLSGGRYAVRAPAQIRNQETLNYFPGYKNISNWVDEHVPSQELILISARDSNYLHVLTKGNRRFEIINTCMGRVSFSVAKPCTPPYISFWVYKGATDPNEPRDFLQGISEPALLSTIRERDVKYIFVTSAVYSLYYYLKIHPDFEEIGIIDNVAIFRVVKRVQPIANYPSVKWTTCVGKGTPEYLTNLKETDPARYEMKLRTEIEPWMGLNEQDLEAFMNWEGCQFEVNFPGSYNLP